MAGLERTLVPILLECGDVSVEASASVPAEPMRPSGLVPLFQGVTDAVVAMAAEAARRSGRAISCRAGCGACCRQLVPVSEAEAFYLAGVVNEMPPDRRDRVRERFTAALRGVGKALLERLRDTRTLKDIEARRAIGQEYFQRGQACPFLENESCSIHEQRPLACREYLVTSPPAECSRYQPGAVAKVPLPAKPSEVLYCFGDGAGNAETRWVPLVLALEWAAGRGPEYERAFDAPEMFRNFVRQLAS